MKEEAVYLDGRIVPAAQAVIPATSRAALYGEGLFETFRTYDGTPFLLARHIMRLKRSAEALSIPIPPDLFRAELFLPELLSRHRLKNAVVRLSVLASTAPGGFAATAKRSHLLAMVRPLPMSLDTERQQGVAAVTRNAGTLPLSAHKATAYLRSVVAARGAARRRAREVLFVDDRGNLLEGATSNVFVIVRDALVTPPADGRILPGVTREVILEIAATAGLPHREHPVTPKLLAMATGLFITNSVIEILPLVSLDGRPVGSGRPHPLAKMFHDLYRERVAEETGFGKS